MKLAFLGLIAGFLATMPMSVLMLTCLNLLPRKEQYPLPPQEIVEQIARVMNFRSRINNSMLKYLTIIAHFGYGTVMGGIFGFLMTFVGNAFLVSGIIYGLAVWAGSYLILLPMLKILTPATEHPKRRNVMMIFAHIVWGGALGTIFSWINILLT